MWRILAFLFLLSACTPKANQFSSRPVIQVNENTLSARDFADLLARRLKRLDALAAKDPNNVNRAKDEILRVFILNALVSSYASSQKISISPTELDAEINSVRSSYPDDVAFRRVLAEEGISLTSWKSEIEKTLLERKVFQKVAESIERPTKEEIQSYFITVKDRFKRKERVYLRQIVVDEISKAQALRDEVRKKDFVDLAKKYSVAPEAKAGGLVGWIERGSVDIFDKAFTLSIGGISQVLESTYGFHIFKVERKAPAGYASFEEVRDILEQEIRGQREQAAFKEWLDKQIRVSRVLRDNRLLDAIRIETRGSE